MQLLPALRTAASIARLPGPSMVAAEAAAVKDCGLACIAFFSNMRVPAALIAAAAVKVRAPRALGGAGCGHGITTLASSDG
jgi:hypothetical protein